MIDAEIFDAFAIGIAVFAAGYTPSLPVAFPNVQFTPPAAGAWLEVAWFPNETVNYGVGNAGPSQHRGFVQVAVAVRKGAGLVPPADVAGAVLAMFEKGTIWGPARVYRKGWISSVVQDTDRVMMPITIPYLASEPRDALPALVFDGGDATPTPVIAFDGVDATPETPAITLDAGDA